MKPKGVTTQMTALDEYFVTAVFTLLLNRVHVFAIKFEPENVAFNSVGIQLSRVKNIH